MPPAHSAYLKRSGSLQPAARLRKVFMGLLLTQKPSAPLGPWETELQFGETATSPAKRGGSGYK